MVEGLFQEILQGWNEVKECSQKSDVRKVAVLHEFHVPWIQLTMKPGTSRVGSTT